MTVRRRLPSQWGLTRSLGCLSVSPQEAEWRFIKHVKSCSDVNGRLTTTDGACEITCLRAALCSNSRANSPALTHWVNTHWHSSSSQFTSPAHHSSSQAQLTRSAVDGSRSCPEMPVGRHAVAVEGGGGGAAHCTCTQCLEGGEERAAPCSDVLDARAL